MWRSVWVGFDPREADAYAVARSSCTVNVSGLVLADLKAKGLYNRPTERRTNSEGRSQLWDVISEAPMSTEHAVARFLVPKLAQGWAMFVDGDVLFRADVQWAFGQLDNSKALYCVQHDYAPLDLVKMDGQVQSQYARKNWSSVMLFNCDHEANKRLTVEMVNTLPGRDLHRFCWLKDDEIGALDPAWNYLVGHSDRKIDPKIEPKIVHFTSGIPSMPGYENCEYADEWRAELNRWAS